MLRGVLSSAQRAKTGELRYEHQNGKGRPSDDRGNRYYMCSVLSTDIESLQSNNFLRIHILLQPSATFHTSKPIQGQARFLVTRHVHLLKFCKLPRWIPQGQPRVSSMSSKSSGIGGYNRNGEKSRNQKLLPTFTATWAPGHTSIYGSYAQPELIYPSTTPLQRATTFQELIRQTS